MRSYRCPKCGNIDMLPDVCRCPFCKNDMFVHSDEHSRKHCKKCAISISPYRYSERGKRGRPSNKEIITELNKFQKHCRNCGTAHCGGSDEGICERWTPQQIERCPFCGRMPILVSVEGTHAIICDECNVKMMDNDLNTLTCRWNRV